ncbi:uncharacterized protein CANTADRAFT_20210 [Suhomyces tanzawaensis NRRL Y-17324]|uniref:Uncharacterized protein n=1 Tax=Suhomyces tanzawaensis NRRL Y-17324 TaxID=984487 RepID=A0A1E4SM95_9ASCO|nr:uncharacterized protein CANTADRAFT_20210 [Suhomyces tanzawaensis NRRL Y-17324]ODV80633.1 hypothetical protein CANTADRAFT_20210 [Suhomyces tanzawaensis NRRL Y-17324]
METTQAENEVLLTVYDAIDGRHESTPLKKVASVNPSPGTAEMHKCLPKYPNQGIFVIKSSQQNGPGQQLPVNFNPRKAQSMSVNEKVLKWILQIPYSYCNDTEIFMDCYPGVVDSSTSSSISHGFFEYSDNDALIELQARKITRYVVTHYFKELEPEVKTTAADDDDNEEEFFEYGNSANKKFGQGHETYPLKLHHPASKMLAMSKHCCDRV